MQLSQLTNPLAPNLSPATGPEAIQKIGALITTLIRVLLIAGAVVFIFWFILGAIRWMTSSGDKAQVEAARNQITHAFVGLILLFSVFAVIKIVEVVFGVDILKIDVAKIRVSP